jgi:NADPH-dependent stearoyl-CoA 9-desaturase
MSTASKALTRDEADAFGRELDELRREIVAGLGQRDVDHIRRVMTAAHASEAVGRILLALGYDPVTFAAGVAALSLSKILDNMEIGHNIIHGQYDWTRDPALDSRRYEWDIACAAEDWRHAHNYEHHTFTNVLGKDRDVGYAWLRVFPEQEWLPRHLVQPALVIGLALAFEWGIATHDLHIVELLERKEPLADLPRRARPFVKKAAWQLVRDYALFPALAWWNAPRVFAGNLAANVIRNIWAFAIIFCGHFPEGTRLYSEDEAANESRGQWYARQVNGSSNIDGGRWLQLLSGHLSHQIEHHLFPDLPAARYAEIAPRVRDICRRHGQSYRSGSLARQLGSVARRIVTLAMPTAARAKPTLKATPQAKLAA